MDLAGRHVIVTGASSGIGRATALLLAREGMKVFAAARDLGRLETLAGEQTGIFPIRADVAIDTDRATLVEAATDVDVLVNNAGLGWHGLVERMPAEEVRRLFEINVLGLIDLTQRVLPAMLDRGRGHVVNVGSIAGYVSAPPGTVYSATKFAVQGFTDGLRREVMGRGVDVTLIAPGPINTEFETRSKGGPTGQLDNRGISPDYVARAVLRALTREKVPGYRTITVPRIAGFSRLGSWPGLARFTDLATRGEAKRAHEG